MISCIHRLDFGKGLIFGKVANDKVFRVVDMYHTGIWDRERALKEIKVYPAYDQIAFITQKAMDIYYHSTIAEKIHRGIEGVQYLDFKVLVQILCETEKELLA
ncbi:MAG: DUF3990 domain-containing protein [Lachnospiraceae bacterium]|nr:DUF3990 domain-containing protein [Lachnospiraceae bacterium]